MKLNDQWAQVNRAFTRGLASLYENTGEPQALLFEAMQYSLLAGGKRLRPFLVHLFCQACGGTQAQAEHAAYAIEMIHTYSLIHDDLPCMDNDDYRRGKLTNHKVFGQANAVLAGDGLLTDAFRVLTLSPNSVETVCACVRVLSENAGPFGMVGGQVLDMSAEERECTPEEVLAIHTRKTGGLIRAACEMGVLCGGGTDAQRNAARAYADAVGLAFQIRDDILDATGDAATLGKAVGVDGNKNTFVKLYGVEACQQMVDRQTQAAIAALDAFPQPTSLRELALYLAQRDH